LAIGPEPADISGTALKDLPFHVLDQYTTDEFHSILATPSWSILEEYLPEDRSMEFFLETSRRFKPVALFHPIFSLGSIVSVG
jgi:hypothetical protein